MFTNSFVNLEVEGGDDGASALLLPVSAVGRYMRGWTFHWHLSPKPWPPLELGGEGHLHASVYQNLGTFVFLTLF